MILEEQKAATVIVVVGVNANQIFLASTVIAANLDSISSQPVQVCHLN